MKKIITIMALVLTTIVAHAKDAVYIKLTTGETIVESLANITEMKFSADASQLNVNIGGTVTSIAASTISEITYGDIQSSVTVTYSGTSATVINPFHFEGMSVVFDGGYVTLNNTDEATERTVSLTGTTNDGGFTYNGTYKATIQLNGVSITSTRGAAIDLECGKRMALNIKKGTTNTLVDCANGSQKACLYCKGHLEIDKTGTLSVTGKTAHAISAKEYIQLKNSTGIINILGAVKDGIHCKQYFLGEGFTVNISGVQDDGIQVELDGDVADAAIEGEDYLDGTFNVLAGTYNITTTANASKGINAAGSVNISDGTFTFTQTGSYTNDGTDISYVTAIKSDKDINIMGGNITINNTADGGKGLSADGNIKINNPDTVIDITANGTGGAAKVNADSTTSSESSSATTTKSYKVYVALPTTGSSTGQMGPGQMGQSQYWTTLYLYKSDGTLVQQLTATVSKTSGSTTKSFYYYDFKASDSGTYYFQSDPYTSRGGSGTFSIKSATFSGPTSGEDYYYEITNSYTTSGTVRTFTLSNVTSTWNGSSSESAEDSGEGYNASGIKADGDVTITYATVTIKNSGVMSKSIKSKGTVTVDSGTLTLTPSGGMQVINNDASYSTGIKAVDFVQNGGSITITASGAASRGISATNVSTYGGTLKITNSGAGQSGTNDTYTAKGIKADSNISLYAGDITISMTGTGGKGIKSSGTYTQGVSGGSAPTLTVTTTGSSFGSTGSTGGWGQPGGMGGSSSGSSAKAIKVMGAAVINGGQTFISTSTDGAEGLESKTSINIAGGNHYFHCYDDCINCSGQINFSGGNTVCWGYGNDAVDSNYGRSGAITISGGNVFAYSTKGAPEEGLDCDNNSYITVTSGIAVSAGAAQGGGGMGGSSSSIGSSSQGYYLGSSPSSYGTSYYYTLCNTSGTPICTYKFEASCSNSLSLLTGSNLGKGSVTVKYGTTAPTMYDSKVNNAAGVGVFYVNPTIVTTGTTATVTSK